MSARALALWLAPVPLSAAMFGLAACGGENMTAEERAAVQEVRAEQAREDAEHARHDWQPTSTGDTWSALVVLPDGREVVCLAYSHASGSAGMGGLSCDWPAAVTP